MEMVQQARGGARLQKSYLELHFLQKETRGSFRPENKLNLTGSFSLLYQIWFLKEKSFFSQRKPDLEKCSSSRWACIVCFDFTFGTMYIEKNVKDISLSVPYFSNFLLKQRFKTFVKVVVYFYFVSLCLVCLWKCGAIWLETWESWIQYKNKKKNRIASGQFSNKLEPKFLFFCLVSPLLGKDSCKSVFKFEWAVCSEDDIRWVVFYFQCEQVCVCVSVSQMCWEEARLYFLSWVWDGFIGLLYLTPEWTLCTYPRVTKWVRQWLTESTASKCSKYITFSN